MKDISSTDGKPTKNRLAQEKSPYLLQHATNPVDWYPWGPEAFEAAQKEKKPIFLSIGYSTCHWCHVMAHESFADHEVAELLNNIFICIKVDREEHPAVDEVYMKVCHLLTGLGGWPLTIFMTPDKKPFFAGTYIPKHSQFGRQGLLELLPVIQEIWENQRQEVLDSAQKITTRLKTTLAKKEGEHLDEGIMHQAFDELSLLFDNHHGGFGRAPKFPTPHIMMFLLRYWHRTHAPRALAMVEKTLQNLRSGGIYDHIGFGFHRYSTDRHWRVPHFEKMLYDQALLALTYLECYQATHKETYADTAREIFTYVLRDLTSPQGGFYSAEDADSEGKEGKFYLWQLQDLQTILTDQEKKIFTTIYNIHQDGNFHDGLTDKTTGDNIPHKTRKLSDISQETQMSYHELTTHLPRIRQKLFAHREKRIHPLKDDKILTDWNGLMIAALAKGARVLHNPQYQKAARKAADFLLETMWTPHKKLYHRYRNGDIAFPGTIKDYTHMIWGLLELYETTFHIDDLQRALELNTILLTDFWDTDTGGFFTTPHTGEQLLIRPKEIYDGAVPSGNSVAMLNLLRLSHITGDPELKQKAEHISTLFSSQVTQSPSGYCFLLCALDFAVGPTREIVLAGTLNNPKIQEIRDMLHQQFNPNQILLFRPLSPSTPDITRIAPFTANQTGIKGHPTVYICRNHTCQVPLTDKKQIFKALSDIKNRDENSETGD